MKRILHFLDPHRQSFLYFRWSFGKVFVIFMLCWWMTANWDGWYMKALMYNIFVYGINYLTHEVLGHNFVGGVFWFVLYDVKRELGSWFHTLAGNGVETLVPLSLYLYLLRIAGGRYLTPFVLYWLGTTLYGAGRYALDARACSLPLTSSDMMTNYAPGEICGDWNHILEPLGLLEYDQIIGMTFIALGMFCALMALWSIYEGWFRNHPIQATNSADF